MRKPFHILAVVLAATSCIHQSSARYLVGVGKSDITGPVADVNLMGYANPEQTARGLHTRLYARAFIFAQPDAPQRRFVFVNLDACMASQLVTLHAVRRIQQNLGLHLYSRENIAISGTHTHASPAGFLQYVLYSVTSLGFVRQSFDALVDGIVTAVRTAHDTLGPGRVYVAQGLLPRGAVAINRSPTAYAANPPQERELYTSEGDVDRVMTLLRLDGMDGRPLGLLSWFAVHCTSINNTNRLVSGDNKGAAELIAEAWGRARVAEWAATNTATKSARSSSSSSGAVAAAAAATATGFDAGSGEGLSAERHFVAAFAQGSVGDTSPNTAGPFCIDTGEPCDNPTSTCGGRAQQCHGRGPAWPDDVGSAWLVGRAQADAAATLWDVAKQEEVVGPIDSRHTYLDMASGISVPPGPGKARLQGTNDSEGLQSGVDVDMWWSSGPGTTCPAAMGWSFAAGTTDGPGAFDFTQGDTHGSNPFWRLVSKLVLPPSKAQVACHAPKPILLDTGSAHTPYDWQPRVTEVVVARLGQVVVAGFPGEPTTMAGRRVKRAVVEAVGSAWGPSLKVAIAGLTNTYSSYITTAEEYAVQRYEGASTIYGPHTLAAYIQAVLGLVGDMLADRPTPPPTSTPPDLLSRQLSFLPPVVLDAVPPGTYFGQVIRDVAADRQYKAGDIMAATFRSACPRNNLHTNGTFIVVERWEAGDSNGAGEGGRGASEAYTTAAGGSAWSETAAGSSSDGRWVRVHDDEDWCTRFSWGRPHTLSPESFATVRWEIPTTTQAGLYRLKHYGDHKPLQGSTQPFNGTSSTFRVVAVGGTHVTAGGVRVTGDGMGVAPAVSPPSGAGAEHAGTPHDRTAPLGAGRAGPAGDGDMGHAVSQAGLLEPRVVQAALQQAWAWLLSWLRGGAAE